MTHRQTYLTALAGVVLLATVLVWLNVTTVAAWFITRQLHHLGFTDVSVDIRSITVNRSHVNKLHLTSPTLEINARDINLQFQLSELLHARIDDANIASLNIVFNDHASASAGNIIPVPVQNNLLATLPFRHLAIEQAHITLPENSSGITQIKAKAEINHQQARLTAQASLPDDKQISLVLQLMTTSDNTLRLTAQQAASTTPFVDIQASHLMHTQTGFNAQVDTHADVAGLQPLISLWLPQYSLLDRFKIFKGHGLLAYDTAQNRLQLDSNIDLQGTDQSLHGPLTLSYQDKAFSINLGESFQISAYQQHIIDLDIPVIDLSVSKDITCHFTMINHHWQCGEGRLAAIVPELRYTRGSLHSQPGSITLQSSSGDPGSWQATINVDLPDIRLVMPDNTLKLDKLNALIDVSQKQITAKATVEAANGQLDIKISAQHDMQQHTGKASISLPVTSVDAQHNIYGALLHRWPYPIHIEAGKLSAQSGFSWQQRRNQLKLTQRTVVNLTDINGRYRQYPFKKLHGQLVISGIDPLRITSSEHVRIDSIVAGVPIHDLILKGVVTYKNGQSLVTELQQAEAGLLGGRIQASPTVIDLNKPESRLLLNLQNIDMEELVKLEQKQGLRSTGRLTGKLPLLISKQGISMSNGRLAALSPYGVIQYHGNERVAALAKNNANLTMLLKALDDFHYDLLEADLDYAPDGKLLARLRLQGNNPELEGGQSVRLNINLEENIPKLLHSLQFADEISQQIEKGLQQSQQKH